jgi:hypothetical protein
LFYAFVAEEASGPTRVNAMAFYLFAYLVPFELIFNLEYLRFRLDHPAELDIVRKHLQFYSKMPDEREENSHTLSTLKRSDFQRYHHENHFRKLISRE